MKRVCLSTTALLALTFAGCGDPKAGAATVPTDDRDRIAKHLETAGVRGEIAAIEDAGDHWEVVLSATGAEKRTASSDGQSQLVEQPKLHRVYKADGRVVDPMKPPTAVGQRR